jgi:hypothetical protein
MPYSLEFDLEHRILLVIHEGEVHGWEIEKLGDELRPHLGELNPSVAISDFSTATTVNVSSQMIRHLATKDTSFPQTMRRFIVAPPDHLFGLARMYEMSADPPFAALQVVRSREEALTALGGPNLKLERLVLAPPPAS